MITCVGASLGGKLFSDAHNAGANSNGRPDIHLVSGNIRVTGGSNGTAYPFITAYGVFNDDDWHHVVLVVRSGINEVTLYVDGSFVGSNVNICKM